MTKQSVIALAVAAALIGSFRGRWFNGAVSAEILEGAVGHPIRTVRDPGFRSGLDIALVIDGTGSMQIIIKEIRAGMGGLMREIHGMVPTARIGIVVFGGKGRPMDIRSLTPSPHKLEAFLSNIKARDGEWEEDALGGVKTAMDRMDWMPYRDEVIVLVGDSPPRKEDFGPLVEFIRKFKGENGAFDTIDVAAEEHRRFVLEWWREHHHRGTPAISPLPEFYQQTRQAYEVLASAGGGTMRTLPEDGQIDHEILALILGHLPSRPSGPPIDGIQPAPAERTHEFN
jgi:hypothetical protein